MREGVRVLLLVALPLAASYQAAQALTAQNQCPGDCSPCLGPTDPFCSSGGSTGDSGGGVCQICETTVYSDGTFGAPKCVDVGSGESGYTSCTTTTTATKVTCSTSGSRCVGQSTTP